MNKKAIILIILLAAFSLSACSGNSASTADSTGAEVVASSVSTVESDGAKEAETATTENEPTSSFEQVETSVSETESSQSVTPESSDAPPTETSQQTSEPKVETTESQQPNNPEETPPPAETSKPKETSSPAETSKPEETPAPTETSQPEESKEPETPPFDISAYVSYAKNYGTSIGLALDSTATGCWDTPMEAHTGCIYLERDIRDRLDWYLDSGFTGFWVWSEDLGGGNYFLYIGYA